MSHLSINVLQRKFDRLFTLIGICSVLVVIMLVLQSYGCVLTDLLHTCKQPLLEVMPPKPPAAPAPSQV